MPILAVVSLVAFATLTGVSTLLPTVIFGTIMSTILPVSVGVLLALAITAALIYLAVNHNKQDDNQYKLDFMSANQSESTVDPTEPSVKPLAPVLSKTKSEIEPIHGQESQTTADTDKKREESPPKLSTLLTNTDNPVYAKKNKPNDSDNSEDTLFVEYESKGVRG